MKPTTKKILKIVLLLLIIALGIAAIVFYPYYRMPPESTEALDAKLAEYQKVAQEMESRPVEDRQAFEALMQSLQPLLQPHKDEARAATACPHYDAAKLAAQESFIRQVNDASAPFDKILAGGLILQQGANVEDDVIDFKYPREFADWQLAAAVLACDQDRAPDFYRHLARVFHLTEAFYNVPDLIYPLIAVAIEDRVRQMFVHLLPRLPADDLPRLAEKLAKLPDPRAAYGRSLRAEVATLVRTVDNLRGGKPAPEGLPFFGRALTAFAGATGYLYRERYMVLSLTGRDVEAYDAWLAAGGKDPLPAGDPKAYRHSPMVGLGWPSVGKLGKIHRDAYVKRQAVIAAFTQEQQARQTGQPAEYAADYDPDEKSRIVVNRTAGCLDVPPKPSKRQHKP
jgi:hypothetical protein